MPHTHSHTSITYLSWLFSGIKRSILSHHFVCCFCFLIVRDHIFIHRLGTALHCRSNPKQRARLSIFSLQHESLCAFLQFFFVFHSCSAADQSSAILKIVSELIPNTHANVYSFYIIISCVPRVVRMNGHTAVVCLNCGVGKPSTAGQTIDNSPLHRYQIAWVFVALDY